MNSNRNWTSNKTKSKPSKKLFTVYVVELPDKLVYVTTVAAKSKQAVELIYPPGGGGQRGFFVDPVVVEKLPATVQNVKDYRSWYFTRREPR